VAAPANAEVEALRAKIAEVKTDAERARLRRALAERLAGDGLKTEAVAELRALLAEDRVDAAHFYNVGNALARLDESNDAIEAYRKAVGQRRGNYSRAQHNLGVVLTRLGRWEEAREALATAVRLEGGIYPEASYNLGRLHAARGEAGPAIAEWTRALAHQPTTRTRPSPSRAPLAEDGDPDRGLLVLDAFSKRLASKGAPPPREIEVTRGEIVAAVNTLASSANAPTANASSARAERASSADARGGSSGALRAPGVDQQTYELLRRARAARDGARNDEAVTLYRRVIERRGGYFAPATLELGFALSNLRRGAEAVEAFRAVTDEDGARYPVAYYHLGRLYEQAGDLARARESFGRAAALYGDANPQPLLDLSRVSERAGDARAAAESLERYVSLMSRAGGTPEWAETRLAELRKKAASQTR
jgi:tetratricopeptide (TPR) repeat protein